MPQLGGRRSSEGFMASCKKFLWHYAPETVGLVSCISVAAYLRVTYVPEDGVNAEVWAEITRNWPILLTADTLLALQAMLRLLVLISSVLRRGSGPTALAQEAAVLLCGAALGRSLLAARGKSYFLDGPLGGYLPVACEVLSVPLLGFLSRGICKQALAASVLTLFVAARIAQRNRLSLADGDAVADSLFVFAHIAELLAAFAYLSRTLLLDTGLVGSGKGAVALRFAHFLMPLQQCMAAYYFVQAFEFSPGLVGAGHPFEILQVGGVTQLAAFACAALLYLVDFLDSPVEDEVSQSAAVGPQHVAVRAAL